MKPVCVIVGAGPGLGLAIARRFAEGGYAIALISRSSDKLDDMAMALRADGLEARGFVADAGDQAALAAALDQVTAWAGEIEVLIYNAARLLSDDVTRIEPADLRAANAVNVEGAITSVNALLPHMRAQARGTILLTGGGLALEPYPDWATLAMGKAALRSYGLSLHKELSEDGIHVAVIAVCGIVASDGPFDPKLIAEAYWDQHGLPAARRRELVYLPDGADPYYNDSRQRFRETSLPIKAVARPI